MVKHGEWIFLKFTFCRNTSLDISPSHQEFGQIPRLLVRCSTAKAELIEEFIFLNVLSRSNARRISISFIIILYYSDYLNYYKTYR